jgi:hypothetical protein
MDEGVIDIRKYLNSHPGSGTRSFSVWGGEGERARFALPVWRSVFLVGGERGGIYSQRVEGGGKISPFFVLDLGQDTPRTDFSAPLGSILFGKEAPSLLIGEGGKVSVFLGVEGGRRWFLEVIGGEAGAVVEGKKREELLFLAGECAGLLFFREFADQGE